MDVCAHPCHRVTERIKSKIMLNTLSSIVQCVTMGSSVSSRGEVTSSLRSYLACKESPRRGEGSRQVKKSVEEKYDADDKEIENISSVMLPREGLLFPEVYEASLAKQHRNGKTAEGDNPPATGRRVPNASATQPQ